MEKNQQVQDVSNVEEPKKRKSRFGVVLGVVVVSLALVFSYLTLSQKEKYQILDNSSKTVKSMISSIKDIRTLKGYKVIEKNGDNKLVMVSAGLSYDPEASIEVVSVEFEKNSAKIIVKENINSNPEKEKITYPFIIVKLSSQIGDLKVVNESGEEYEEIFLNKHTNEDPIKKDEEEIQVEEVNEEVAEDLEETEEEKVEEEQTKTLACVYEGKADGTTIEVSIGSEYRTFDISNVVGSFNDMEIGKHITIEYIDTQGNGKVVSVK